VSLFTELPYNNCLVMSSALLNVFAGAKKLRYKQHTWRAMMTLCFTATLAM
jgi:hypothetical protein